MTADLVCDFVDERDAQFYICGTTRFMADVQDGLEAHGVAPERIHSESFGPRG